MHTYRKADGGGWQAGYQHPNSVFIELGPVCDFEWEAAAIACFLNGGRYCPDEIAPIFAVPLDDEEAEPEDHTTPPSKGNFADYPHEQIRKRQEVPTS